ncbi:lysophospholipid acyltransferase family protein [Metabacillus litoralis]|uniref:lysophospholipid acyltransferase family protein n=1 Tax=Metabacillus litoralis TaxID=152268 RepID=UPI001CFDB3F9|nr:lysophospholipid acyltransferase family protein [Metabacillus litoralis]
MLRMISTILIGYLYIIYKLPHLSRIKRSTSDFTNNQFKEEVHMITKRWARLLVKLTGSTVTVHNESNIPKGPVLIVSNHQGNFDIPVIIGYLQKPAGFLAKNEMKKVPFASVWMEAIGCVLVKRNDRRGAIQAFHDSVEELRRGQSLIVFPEGTRSKGTEIGQFKTGAIRMALEARIPILPITVSGTYKIMEKNKGKKFTSSPIDLYIHKPLYLDDTTLEVKEITELIRNAIKYKDKS